MSAQGIPLKSDFRERARANDVPVARLIGFEAKEVTDGRATVMLAAGPQHANPMGTLHGGILCDIADAAMGMAFASTLAPEESFTTVELKVNFFRPIWQAQLKAEATVVQRGRPIGCVACGPGQNSRRRQPESTWAFPRSCMRRNFPAPSATAVCVTKLPPDHALR
jgi:uncharacterized protein (TIGR00369 family)